MPKRPRPRRTNGAADGAAEQPGWDAYTASFREQILPHLLKSAYMLSVADAVDPKSLDLQAATELGLMLMLDKPIVVICPTGTTISPALRRAATVVLDDFDVDDPSQQDRIAAAFKSLGAPTGDGDGS